MPVIGIPVAELLRCTRREIPRDDLLRVLGEIGCDVDGFEVLGRVRVRALAASSWSWWGRRRRPPRCERCDADLRAPAALDRLPTSRSCAWNFSRCAPTSSIRAASAAPCAASSGIEIGLVEYPVAPAVLRLRVDPSVRREQSLRPWIAAAVLESVTLDEDRLKIVMKMQENLHWALGRNRKHASIGVYDLDSLGLESPGSGTAGPGAPSNSSTRRRTPTAPPSSRWAPPEPARSTGSRCAPSSRSTPRGRRSRTFSAASTAIRSCAPPAGRVLSMPPIINSEETKVTPGAAGSSSM